MQNIDDYIRKSISFAVENMGGQPQDAVRIYRKIVTKEGFDKKMRYKIVNNPKVVRVNPVKSSKRLLLNQDEKLIFEIIYLQSDVTYEDLESNSRKRELVDVRKRAMVLFAIYLNYTYKKVGELFGSRDHSTVIHAVNSHDDLLHSDSSYALKFKKLLDEVKETLPRYFNTVPVTLKQLKNDFDQAKWERFATKWAKDKRDLKELNEIKEVLSKYGITKENQYT